MKNATTTATEIVMSDSLNSCPWYKNYYDLHNFTKFLLNVNSSLSNNSVKSILNVLKFIYLADKIRTNSFTI